MECIKLWKDVYGDNLMSRSCVFELHKRFSVGREEVEDDWHPGHPSTSKSDQKIQKISEIVCKDWCLSVRMIADMVSINRETVRQILHNELNIQKVCAKLVLKNLTEEQKDNRKDICTDILQKPDLLENVITRVGFFWC